MSAYGIGTYVSKCLPEEILSCLLAMQRVLGCESTSVKLVKLSIINLQQELSLLYKMTSQFRQSQLTHLMGEPDAVNALKGISQNQDREDILITSKFPFKTCRYDSQDQNISNWDFRGTSYQSLLSGVPENTQKKLKTLLKGRRQMGKEKQYKTHQRKYTDSIMQNVQKQLPPKEQETKKIQQGYKTRCALNNINPDIVGIHKYPRFQTVNGERSVSTRENRPPRISQQKKCMAIKKIKKELLSGLQSRARLFQCNSTQRQKLQEPKKSKFCSEIHLNLQLLNDRQSFKENNPKHMRLVSLHNYSKIRYYTLGKQGQRSGDQIQGERIKKSVEYQMLKTLLYREKM